MQRKPRSLLGSSMWIVVILALGYGGFVAYERWWGTPEFKVQVSEVQQKVGRVLGTAAGWVTDLVKQSAKETAGDVIISASDALGVYGEQVKGTMSASAPTQVPIDIGISVVVANPLSFFLPPAIFYSADWGDGRKEEKNISVNSGITISHRWSAPGRYEVVIEIRNGERVSKESFMVNVANQ